MRRFEQSFWSVDMSYSESFRASMVKRLLDPRGSSATALSAEVGVSQATLSRWLKQYGENKAVSKARRADDWTAAQRLEAIVKTQGMAEDELGACLRSSGLHSSDLEQWRKDILDTLTPRGRGRPKKDPEVLELRKSNKQLSKELNRKDKALAEASALLVLQKKAQLIWGVKEDDK